MSAAAPQIKGWCPSAWRPMLSGDGYLVRLRFSCGIVTSDQARAIADLARRYGNGFVDLTRRANLQIRGVAEERIAGLQAQLCAKGLLVQDEGEGPNVIVSPLAGRDPQALIDIRPLVKKLDQRLVREIRTHDLPAKFCIVLEDGGRFCLREINADIAFEASEVDGDICFSVRIGDASVGFVETHELEETALALMAVFIKLRNGHAPHVRRMRDLVEAVGLSAITASCLALARASTTAKARQSDREGPIETGHHVVGPLADDAFGVAAPFGAINAGQLALLSDVAERHAESELRLTPRRAILIPAIASGTLDRVKAECARAGLITDPSDPRRRIEACAGAPACASASVETREIAAGLAPLLRPQDTLHVSGCAKGCASSAAASITLVGLEGGFDLVRNGNVSDTPALFGLSAEEARIAVERIPCEDLAHV